MSSDSISTTTSTDASSTDTQQVPVTGTDVGSKRGLDVNVVGGTIEATGGLTDAELRASPVPVSGPLTDAELRAAPVPVSGPLTDAQLRASPVPVAAAQSGTWTVQPGNTPNTSPWLVSVYQGGNAAPVVNTRPALSAYGLVVRALPYEPATFIATAESIAIGNNKSMLALVNAAGSGVVLRINSIKIINVQLAAVTGVNSIFQLRRITSYTGGTGITMRAFATADAIPSQVTAGTGVTVSGETAANIMRWFFSSDEWGTGTTEDEHSEHDLQSVLYAHSLNQGVKPITCTEGEGIHIRHAVNSTVGTFDLQIIFTLEAA